MTGPKMATYVDDFRYEKIDQTLWTSSGPAPTVVFEGSDSTRGLQVNASTTVTSAMGTPGLNFNDSECVFQIASWAGIGTTGICETNISQGVSGNQYQFGFRYQGGTLTLRMVMGGVTSTSVLSASFTSRYLRLSHTGVTGLVDFWVGDALDGSDQRRVTPVAWNTQISDASFISDMNINMSRDAGTGFVFVVGSVNAAGELVSRHPGYPSAYLYRDFSTWYAGSAVGGEFSTTTSTGNKEFIIQSVGAAGSNMTVEKVSQNKKVLVMRGHSTAKNRIRTQLPTVRRNISIEVPATEITRTSSSQFLGITWREQVGNGITGCYYEMRIYQTSVQVWTYQSNTPLRRLASVAINNYQGVRYIWKLSHFDDTVAVSRDGVEIMNFNDIIGYPTQAGDVGLSCNDTVGAASATPCVFYVDSILVQPITADLGNTSGVPFYNRDLGVHVQQGIRGAKTTMSSNTAIVGSLENQLDTHFKYVYHFTPYSNVVDTPTIDAARVYAKEGRINVIAWNAFHNTKLTDIATSASDATIDAMATAVNTIGGTVYLAPLPYPDVLHTWSPFVYDVTNTVSSYNSGTGVITVTGTPYTTNQFSGKQIRWIDASGISRWGTVASNTTSTITLTGGNPTNPPVVTQAFFIVTATTIGGTAAAYQLAFRYIVSRLQAQGCKARILFALNNAPSAGDSRYTGYVDDLHPGDAYVHAGLLRLLYANQVRSISDTWISPQDMLVGTTGTYSADPSTQGGTNSPYNRLVAISPSKPILLLAGTYEPAHLWNDFESAYNGASASDVNVADGLGVDAWESATNGANSVIESPPFLDLNAKLAGTKSNVVKWTNPTTGYHLWRIPVNSMQYFSVSTHVNWSALGLSTEGTDFLVLNNNTSDTSSGAVVVKLSLNAQTRQVTVRNATNTVLATLGTALSDNFWYRLELTLDLVTPGSHSVSLRSYKADLMRGETAGVELNSVTATGLTLGTPKVIRVGPVAIQSGKASLIGGYWDYDNFKVSWDGLVDVFDKTEWIASLLNTRGYENVQATMLMSADQPNDITTYSALTAQNRVNYDTRLDASKKTIAGLKSFFSETEPGRIYLQPQVRPSAYVSSSLISNLEYMRLEEDGVPPLVLAPRMSGILLKDFDLGTPTIREAVEQRPGNDGTRDYSRFVGSKSVSLDVLCFDDNHGSAAYYREVLSSWMAARRRPRLVYKMKNGVERYMNLRPNNIGRPWNEVDIRIGVVSGQMQFVAIDGKEYSTTLNEAFLYPFTSTEVFSYGTIGTDPIIQLHGGANGCSAPYVYSSTEESLADTARAARLSLQALPNYTSFAFNALYIPANCYLEIDVAARKVQFMGRPERGYSYNRYLYDRTWFRIEPVYNRIYFGSTGLNNLSFGVIKWRDAYL